MSTRHRACDLPLIGQQRASPRFALVMRHNTHTDFDGLEDTVMGCARIECDVYIEPGLGGIQLSCTAKRDESLGRLTPGVRLTLSRPAIIPASNHITLAPFSGLPAAYCCESLLTAPLFLSPGEAHRVATCAWAMITPDVFMKLQTRRWYIETRQSESQGSQLRHETLCQHPISLDIRGSSVTKITPGKKTNASGCRRFFAAKPKFVTK
ncbi:hypothetical protein J6590_083066 [Homalodisca vitripennis]|nr:hypothetical protein J6590_083066 [Homalodisca vitripennis]